MRVLLVLTLFICITACTSKNDNSENTEENPKSKITMVDTTVNTSENDMSNPVLMTGSDIGSLFNTYYKLGHFAKMIQYTDSSTINNYGRENLLKMYRKLNLGYDIKLSSFTTEGNEKILHYKSLTFATKGIRRLHVVIENDTARIIPQHLEKGDIFE